MVLEATPDVEIKMGLIDSKDALFQEEQRQRTTFRGGESCLKFFLGKA